MKIEQDENESKSANTSVLSKFEDMTEEENPLILNEEVSTSEVNQEIVILQSPEYEAETNNNDCSFYKQSLAKQALAGVF